MPEKNEGHLYEGGCRVLGDWQEWALRERFWTGVLTPADRAFLGRFALTGERKPNKKELAKLTKIKEKTGSAP